VGSHIFDLYISQEDMGYGPEGELDRYRVPVKWCLITGSPTELNPVGVYDSEHSDRILRD
jgi:hypothetical protein